MLALHEVYWSIRQKLHLTLAKGTYLGLVLRLEIGVR